MIHVVVNGNLGADGEIKALPSGGSVLRLRVASSDRDKVDGDWTDVTTWVTVAVFGTRVESLARLCVKGTKISARGKLAVREYDKRDGSRGYSVEVKADDVELMGGPRRDGGAATSAEPSASYSDDIPF